MNTPPNRAPYEPITFYVAAKLEDSERAKRIRDALLALDYQVTYDWTDYEEREKDATEEVYRQTAIDEVNGVLAADVFVQLLHPQARGAHCELGLALGASEDPMTPTQIFLVGDVEGCIFYHHPRVTRIPGFDVAQIASMVAQRVQEVYGPMYGRTKQNT